MTYKNSITLGKGTNGEIYEAKGYQHILLLAPHGSGKGVSFVLPTLLTLDESCIVHDIKLENYQLTSGYRESIGHKIFVFNPLNSENKTHRYNPLDFVNYDLDEGINDLQKIAELLIKGDQTAKALFVGLAIYLSVIKKKITLGEISRILYRDLDKELSDNLKKINALNNKYCFEIVSDFLRRSDESKFNIVNQLKESLYIWTNPFVDFATSDSDFDIASLKKSKVTIYVGSNPDDLLRLQPLMNLFYHQVFEILIKTSRQLGNGDNNGGVSIILDDFCTVGKLQNYSLSYLRGYKVRLFLISSDIQNIQELYGKEKTLSILSDCNFKIFFAPNDNKTAKIISSTCIDKKENVEFLSWQSVMNISPDSQLVLLDSEQPIICKKAKYYDDENLITRILTPVLI